MRLSDDTYLTKKKSDDAETTAQVIEVVVSNKAAGLRRALDSLADCCHSAALSAGAAAGLGQTMATAPEDVGSPGALVTLRGAEIPKKGTRTVNNDWVLISFGSGQLYPETVARTNVVDGAEALAMAYSENPGAEYTHSDRVHLPSGEVLVLCRVEASDALLILQRARAVREGGDAAVPQ